MSPSTTYIEGIQDLTKSPEREGMGGQHQRRQLRWFRRGGAGCD